MTAQWRACALLAGTLPVAAACSSMRVPSHVPVFPDSELRRTTAGPVTLEARPIGARALNWELFDDYLPELGLAAVWLRVTNGGTEPLVVGPRSVWLDLGCKRSRALDGNRILKRYYRARGIRAYSVQVDQKARAALDRVLLRDARIEPGATISGLIFVPLDRRDALTWSAGRLALRGRRLDSGSRVDLALPLADAHP